MGTTETEPAELRSVISLLEDSQTMLSGGDLRESLERALPGRDYEHTVEMLNTVGTMIAEAVRALREVDPAQGNGGSSFRASMDAFEKDALIDALKRARGNRARAARLLSTTERIFNYRVRKHGIDWRKYKI